MTKCNNLLKPMIRN